MSLSNRGWLSPASRRAPCAWPMDSFVRTRLGWLDLVDRPQLMLFHGLEGQLRSANRSGRFAEYLERRGRVVEAQKFFTAALAKEPGHPGERRASR
jgi:hypothetical protein